MSPAIGSESVIDVRGLRKDYRDGLFGRRRFAALRGVTLDVPARSIFGLLGPNGAGKTTLIKVLLGIVRKTAGDARLLGRPAGDRAARRRVGYLPENHRIPQHLTGHTALEYYGMLSGLPAREVKRRRGTALDLVGLSNWGTQSVRKYSKGMLQRLGLAQAMLHDPDLVILDEPTDGVDPVGRTEIRAVLRRLQSEGKTVFLNSHLLQELELVCDRVAILVKGELRRVGTVDELTGATPTQGGVPSIEATLDVEGDERAIREALEGVAVTRWTAVGERRFDVAVRMAGQLQVDVCIDALRARNVSLRALTPKRLTLEEAFLDVVRDSPA